MIKEIKLSPYDFNLIIFNRVKLNKIHQYLKDRNLNHLVSHFDNEYNAITVISNTTDIFIHYRKFNKGLVAHESFHVVEFLFSRIGLKHDVSSSEAWAYLLQYIVEQT